MNVVLKRGDKGESVKQLQELLWSHGFVGKDNPFWSSRIARSNRITSPDDPKAKSFWVDGDFGVWTEAAVIDAQHRLVDEKGTPLDEVSNLGVVDSATWWALSHSSAQNPYSVVYTPKEVGLGSAIVSVWMYYVNKKVREEPKGSNRGPYVPPLWKGASHGGIDAWTGLNPSVKGLGPAWCCYSRIGVEREAHGIVFSRDGFIHANKPIGLCYANMLWGRRQPQDRLEKYINPKFLKGWVVEKEHVISGVVSLPVGAAGIMNYGGTTGHTFSVIGILRDKNGKVTSIITCEGNVSDAVGIRQRSLLQSSLKWFIISPLLFENAVDFEGVQSIQNLKKGEDSRKTTL